MDLIWIGFRNLTRYNFGFLNLTCKYLAMACDNLETDGHATGIRKAGHAIGYFRGRTCNNLWVAERILCDISNT